MKLGEGNAPILNYQLPSSTTFDVKGVFPLHIPRAKFKEARLAKNEFHVWNRAKELSYEQILHEVFDVFHGIRGKFGLFLFFLSPILLFGQNTLEEYKIGTSWYRNEDGINISKELFIQLYASEWGLSSNDELRFVSSEEDDLGYTHYRYEQYYQGYEVEHTDFFLHYKDGLWIAAHASVTSCLNLSIQNGTITESAALNIALNRINATEYAWQNNYLEQELKEETGDLDATYFPEGKLIIHHEYGTSNNAANYHFAWQFEINSSEPLGQDYVYIDASSGEVLSKHSLIKYCNNKPATGTTLYNGNQTFTAKQRNSDFTLEECGNRNIHTKWGYGFSLEVTDDNGNWGTGDMNATSAHWGAEKAWDYFKVVHGWNGCNGVGGRINVFVDKNLYENNIAWSKSKNGQERIRIGKYASNGHSLSSLDLIGHEFTHGVTFANQALEDSGEPAALNESFSDIFGAMIERESQGFVDWIHADDPNPGNMFLRSFENPSMFSWEPIFSANPDPNCLEPILPLTPYPDTYLGNGWYSDFCDAGGSHENLTVQNKFYYLLCVGGSHNNVDVLGIGIEKAEKIAFRTLTEYMGKNSQYLDARAAWINAATDFHGACSFEVIQVMNAWRAVGVIGLANPKPCIQLIQTGFVKNGITYCSNSIISLTATTDIDAPIYTWSFGNNSNVVIINQSQSTNSISITSLDVPSTSIGVHASNSNATTAIVVKSFLTKACRLAANEIELTPEDEGGIRLYPNPTAKNLTLEIDYSQYQQNGELVIMDLQGQNVLVYPINNPTIELNISRLSQGIYFAKIRLGEVEQIIKLEVLK